MNICSNAQKMDIFQTSHKILVQPYQQSFRPSCRVNLKFHPRVRAPWVPRAQGQDPREYLWILKPIP